MQNIEFFHQKGIKSQKKPMKAVRKWRRSFLRSFNHFFATGGARTMG